MMKNIFIISGPAGSGKDSIIDGLRKKWSFERIITSTSRKPRPGEREGEDYYFLSREVFEEKIASEEFLEYSTNENNERYGTTKKEIERVSKLSSPALWKPDWKGVVTAKKIFPEICAILIHAPLEILEERLRRRDTGKDEQYFHERMEYTREWFRHTDIYDHIIENQEDALDEAIQEAANIIQEHLEKK